MTGMRFVWLLPLVALVFGCGGLPTSKELAEIDQLLAAEKKRLGLSDYIYIRPCFV